ncbi:MAG: hypothetical protein GY775_19405 [Candidatus Scalindua sp.]|nr:hypothetical protein [Candidatus Scalindua sp.]
MGEEKRIKFKALGNVIIVKLPQAKQDTEAGLYKGKSVIEAEQKVMGDTYMEVLTVGPKVTDIKIGDNILIGAGRLAAVDIDDILCSYVYAPSVIGIKLD